jgi:phenylacetate-CoA ligase
MSRGYPSRDQIEALQLRRVGHLLGEVKKGNRFYLEKFKDIDLDRPIADLDDFRSRIPFTIKAEWVKDQQAHPPYGTNLTYPLERYARYSQTSATAGGAMRWIDTPQSWQGMVESWIKVFTAARVEPTDRIYFAFSFGPFIGFWLAFEAGTQIGALCLPGGGLSSVARLNAILENRATVLCCTPTYTMRLAEVAREEKIDLSRSAVRLLVVAGEPGGSLPSTRSRMEEGWPGARVFDHHGMTEVGPVTHECPERPGALRVMESSYLAEVIDPASGLPVELGARGELVLTTLERLGSPLIRYRTGDLVQPGEPPSDGPQELVLEGGILSRVDDMVIIRGVNVFPSAIEEIVRSIDGVAEFRVEFDLRNTMDQLRLLIEPVAGRSDPQQLVGALQSALSATFPMRIPVQLVSEGSLPRFEMKARRWTRIEG